MAKVASKQKRISDIALMLEQGLERKQILQKLSKSCKVSARTIDTEIKDAKQILSVRNEEKEAIRQSTTSQTLKEAISEAIISDLEIEAILCKIVTANLNVEEFVKGVPILRGVTPLEIISAAKTLYAKRGSNAPSKIAQTDTDGNNVQPFREDQVENILNVLRGKKS